MKNCYSIASQGNKLLVTTPYNTLFIAAARKVGAKWDPAKSAWEFNKLHKDILDEKLAYFFGDANVPGSLVDVKVSIEGRYFVDRRGIEFFGRPLARATGRDSGAKLVCGDDVVILSGSFRSGGSVKNWDTRVSDAEIVFQNISRALVEDEVEEILEYVERKGTGSFSYEIMEIERTADEEVDAGAVQSESAVVKDRVRTCETGSTELTLADVYAKLLEVEARLDKMCFSETSAMMHGEER